MDERVGIHQVLVKIIEDFLINVSAVLVGYGVIGDTLESRLTAASESTGTFSTVALSICNESNSLSVVMPSLNPQVIIKGCA